MYSAQRGYGVQYVPAPARDFIVDGRARLRLAVNKPRSLYRLCATSVHAPPRTRRGRMARESAPPIVRTGFAKSRCGAGYWATRREPRVRRCQNVHAADQAVGIRRAACGAAAHQQAVHLEQSVQRERVWGKPSSSLRDADGLSCSTGTSIGRTSLVCQRTRASDRLSARLLSGTGGGRQATHRMIHDAPSASSE